MYDHRVVVSTVAHQIFTVHELSTSSLHVYPGSVKLAFFITVIGSLPVRVITGGTSSVSLIVIVKVSS